MASALRPAMLRQMRQQVTVCRVLTTCTQGLLKPAASSKISIFKSHPLSTTPPSLYVPTRQLVPFTSSRFAAFHTSGRRAILPAGPQVINGTANDPAPVPDPSSTHGSYHWAFERLISAALIPLTIAPFAAGTLNPITDAILCATIIIHTHIGFQSVIIDYISAKRFPVTRLVFWWGLRLATLSVAVGFYEFETNDVGLTEAIKRIWVA